MAGKPYHILGILSVKRVSDGAMLGQISVAPGALSLYVADKSGRSVSLGAAQTIEEGAERIMAAATIPDASDDPLVFSAFGILYRTIAELPGVRVAVKVNRSGEINDELMFQGMIVQARTFITGDIHVLSDGWGVRADGFSGVMRKHARFADAVITLGRHSLAHAGEMTAHQRIGLEPEISRLRKSLIGAVAQAAEEPWKTIADIETTMTMERAERRRQKRK